MKKKKNKVYTLHSYYKDGGSTTSLGVFDSPRALVAGLAASIFEDHAAARDARPREIAKIVALAVFDFVSLCGFKSDMEKCRDGDTVFGCCEYDVQSLDDEKEKEAGK